MAEATSTLSCGNCGKVYPWKPQYAGRTLKCACGSAVTADAVAPPPPDLSTADEFERALSECGRDAGSSAAPRGPLTTGVRGAIAAAGAPRVRPKVQQSDERSGIGKGLSASLSFRLTIAVISLIIASLIIAAIVGGIGAVNRYSHAAKNAPVAYDSSAAQSGQPAPVAIISRQDRELAAKEDAETAKVIDGGQASEAREWLKPDQDFHAGERLLPDALRAWVERFYSHGAKTVWITFNKRGRFEMADEFIVEMPDDRAARKAVLRDRTDLLHYMSPVDAGNKYLQFPIDR